MMNKMRRYHGMTPLHARALLNQALMSVEDLAKQIKLFGDPRSFETIKRSIYHAISVDRKSNYVSWAVAAMLNYAVIAQKADLGPDLYSTMFTNHQRRLRRSWRRTRGVSCAGISYAVDLLDGSSGDTGGAEAAALTVKRPAAVVAGIARWGQARPGVFAKVSAVRTALPPSGAQDRGRPAALPEAAPP
jgi:hypothetical protein